MDDLAQALADPGSSPAQLRTLLRRRARARGAGARPQALRLRATRDGRDRRRARRPDRPWRPSPPQLRADPDAVDERAWLLVAALVGALVEAGADPERLVAGELDGSLALQAPGGDPELVPLAFEEQLAGIDRLRARAGAVPPTCSPTRPTSRRRSATPTRSWSPRASPRSAACPADPDSLEQHEDAVLALLDAAAAAATPPARRPRPGPPRSPGGSSSGSTGWGSGAATTRSSRTSRAASRATTASSPRRSARRCSTPACSVEKPSVGQRHVFLNPRRAADIHALIERGDAPPDLDFRRRRSAHVTVIDQIPTSSSPRTPSSRRGHHHARRGPTSSLKAGLALQRWGPTPAAGYTASGDPPPRRRPRSSTSSARSRFARGPPSARTRSPTRCGDAGIGEGDGVAIMCRNHRGFIDADGRLLQARRQRAVPQHRVRRPADHRGRRAREAGGDHLRRASSRSSSTTPASGRKRFIAWHDADEQAEGPAARGPDRSRATPPTSCRPPRRAAS